MTSFKHRGQALLETLKRQTESDSGCFINTDTPNGNGTDRRSQLLSMLDSQNLLTSSTEQSRQENHKADSVSATLADVSLSSNDKCDVKVNSERGCSGKKLTLTSNYIPLKFINEEDKIRQIFFYHVSFTPVVDSMSERFRIMREHTDFLGPAQSFDGSTLLLPNKLNEKEILLTSTISKSDYAKNICVKIKFVKGIDMASTECIHLFNIIFKRIMNSLKMVRIQRSYFQPELKFKFPLHKLEIWPGYVTAIDRYEGGVLLQCDVSHKVLRTETVYDVLRTIGSARRQANSIQEDADRALVGETVLTRYNNKTYRIDEIALDITPTHTFQNHKGQSISYVDYYQSQYNIKIMDLRQPMLLSRSRYRYKVQDNRANSEHEQLIYLVPELCFMTGLSQDIRNNFKVMKDLVACTRPGPAQRQKSVMKLLKSIEVVPEAKRHLTNWGFELDTKTISFEGRQLPQETVILGNNSRVETSDQRDWNSDFSRATIFKPVTMKNWIIVFPAKKFNIIKDFVNMLMRWSNKLGISALYPHMVSLQDDRTDSYLISIRNNVNCQTELVLAVVPMKISDRYAAIKKLTLLELKVASQIVVIRTLEHGDKINGITQKILMQMNVKLGGELWATPSPLKTTMVIGIDVFHDPSRRSKSVVAVVASLNCTFSRWFSKAAFQDQHVEIADTLSIIIIEALQKYLLLNGSVPGNMVVFRDGVGDGRLSLIQEHEVPQFILAMEKFAKTVSDQTVPRLTYINVSKRINTRILLDQSNKVANPPPGTVVDHSITRRNWMNFFLVSQKVNQGTVSPTHYIVVHNGIGFSMDILQRISYKLTHMYYNWPGRIRVPAPCLYAHRLAALVGESLVNLPSKQEDRLFYI